MKMHTLTVAPVIIAIIGCVLASALAAAALPMQSGPADMYEIDDRTMLEHLNAMHSNGGRSSSSNGGGGGGDSGGNNGGLRNNLLSGDDELHAAEKRDPKRLVNYETLKRLPTSTGYKRMPVYNFGLGKRGGDESVAGILADRASELRRPYSFGLGKRDGFETDVHDYLHELTDEDLLRLAMLVRMPELDNYEGYPGYYLPKRARPFDFGMGKRQYATDPVEVERRQRYNFGLGR